MDKLKKFYPRDLIAIITLLACFTLMALGINHLVSGIIIMVVTFYFVRRLDGEGENGRDLHQRMKNIEEKTNQNNEIQPHPKQTIHAKIRPHEHAVKPPIQS